MLAARNLFRLLETARYQLALQKASEQEIQELLVWLENLDRVSIERWLDSKSTCKYEKMTVRELRLVAHGLGIPRYSMIPGKAYLIKAIKDAVESKAR